MLMLLATNWNHLLPQLFWLWLVGWGIRTLLVGVILGGIFWLYKRLR